ncbi:MAG TPA: hypothetical protein VMM38_12095 [Aridibacter sp.]|nr:hypothetical protein [Aridibacter sp.]
MKLPRQIEKEIERRVEDARRSHSASLSKDGKAVLIDGGIGYGAYISPSGDIFLETYDLVEGSDPTYDRTVTGQLQVIRLGSKRIPELLELLPSRPEYSLDCQACSGNGWQIIGPIRIICTDCSGLGWSGPDPLRWP